MRKIIENIKSDLTHQCDGPVTKYVVISRAIELVGNSLYDPKFITDALDEVLEDFVELPSNEFK